jgi:flagellar biosynthesis protein FliP
MDALALICRRRYCAAAVVLLFLSAPSVVFAQLADKLPPGARQMVPIGTETTRSGSPAPSLSPMQLPDLTKRENFSSAMQIIILLTVLSLAPAILIMMTSFTRIIIVLSLLRQALGTQQLPPNQVLIGLSMFMTFLVMSPTWQRVNSEALQPYMEGSMEQPDALRVAQVPVREFMLEQIIQRGNEEDIYLFHEFARKDQPVDGSAPGSTSADAEVRPEDISTMTLVPAFMISELKTAFLLGFKVYLPFLIIDMVISSVLISMGMMMLPPVLISLPFKLLLFVLVDGWHLIVNGLMGSFL